MVLTPDSRLRPSRARPRPGQGRVLVFADDEPEILNLYYDYFTAQGYCVRTALNGHEAVRAICFSPAPVELLVTDLQMPQVDGVLLIEVIQAIRPRLPILVVSADVTSDQLNEGIDGAWGAFRKPASLGRLSTAIDMILNTSTQGRDFRFVQRATGNARRRAV